MYSEFFREQNRREASAEMKILLPQIIFSAILLAGGIGGAVFFRHSLLALAVGTALAFAGIMGCRYNIRSFRSALADRRRNRPKPALRIVR